jgi:hypothetical protein
MVKVIIIGSGNVAQHLIAAFQNSKNTGDEIELVQVFSRKANTLVNRLDADLVTTDLAALLDADLYIIAVSDDAINTVAAMLPLKPISGTHLREYGFRYMTTIEEVFSIRCKPLLKNKPVDFKSIPICLESENPTDFRLDKVAKVISDKAFAINSEQKRYM